MSRRQSRLAGLPMAVPLPLAELAALSLDGKSAVCAGDSTPAGV